MTHLAPLIQDLAIMMVVAGIVTLLFQRIRQPVVLGYLVAGVIIGPYTPPGIWVTDVANIKIISELGVIFLLFSLGFEFSFHKLTRVGFSAGITGIFEVIVMIVIGFLTGKLIGWSSYDSLFLGSAIAISSSTIIVKAIDELGLFKKRFAEIIFAISVVDDLLAILILVFLTTLITTKSIFSVSIVLAVLKLILVIVSWFIIGYFIIPTLFRKIMHYVSDETITIVSVGLCLLLVTIASYFNYSVALGAFIMGSILAETDLIHRIEVLIKPIRDIFVAVFFISVGMLIDPRILLQEWPIILVITAVTIVGKIFGNSVGALLTGQTVSNSLRIGFGMAQVGEFSFIIVALGMSLHVINDKLYPVIVAISAITTFTTPYLITSSGYLAAQIDKRLPVTTKNFLDAYTARFSPVPSSTAKQPSIYRKMMSRLIINGIVVAIIFILISAIILPWLKSTLLQIWYAEVLAWSLALLLSLPFLWGMLFSLKKHQLKDEKPQFKLLLLLVWLLTIVEMISLSVSYFHAWVTESLFVLLGILVLLLTYKYIRLIYQWFEKHLTENIKKQDLRFQRHEELAPWDNHLVEIIIGDFSPFVGKNLAECQIFAKYGINVIAILRGVVTIPVPNDEEKIFPQDKLIVLGEDDKINQFKEQAEFNQLSSEPVDLLKNLVLKDFLIEQDNPYIGQSIELLKSQQNLTGVVVGLVCNRTKILNPDPKTILQQGDLVLIVDQT